MSRDLPPEGPRWDIPDWNPNQGTDQERSKHYLDEIDELHDLRQQVADLKMKKAFVEEPKKENCLNESEINALVIRLDTMARRKPAVILGDEDINAKFDLIEAFLKRTGHLKIKPVSSIPSSIPPILTLIYAAKSNEFDTDLSNLEVARTHFLRWHGSINEALSSPAESEKKPRGFINFIEWLLTYPTTDDPEIAHIQNYLGTKYIKFNEQGVASDTTKNDYTETELKKLSLGLRVLREGIRGLIFFMIMMLAIKIFGPFFSDSETKISRHPRDGPPRILSTREGN